MDGLSALSPRERGISLRTGAGASKRMMRPWRGAALLLFLTFLACAGRRSPAALGDVPRAGGPFTARFTGSLEWRGKGVPLSGLLAVDPRVGARLEFRDPLGGVLLVAFIEPRTCTLLRPADGVQASWDGADDDLPFSAGDLWFLLSGAPPSERMDLRIRSGTAEAAWRNEVGRVELREDTSGAAPAPFTTASLRGPRGSVLRMALAGPRGRAVPEEALRPPSLSARKVPPSELLRELSP